MQKKITNTPHPPQVYNFHSGPLFCFSQCGGFYDHSLRFPIDFIWSLSPFNSLVLLPFVFRRTTQYSDNIFVSKFGFKTPESPLNFDKISFDDSLTRQERRRKTLPRNYTHPKKSMVHATFCSLMLNDMRKFLCDVRRRDGFGCINSGKVRFPKKLVECNEKRASTSSTNFSFNSNTITLTM